MVLINTANSVQKCKTFCINETDNDNDDIAQFHGQSLLQNTRPSKAT